MKCFSHLLQNTSNIFESICNKKEFEETLNQLKILDLELVELCQLVRDYFKWFLLLNISCEISIITIDIYWIYGGFIWGNPYFLRKLIHKNN